MFEMSTKRPFVELLVHAFYLSRLAGDAVCLSALPRAPGRPWGEQCMWLVGKQAAAAALAALEIHKQRKNKE